MMTAARKGTKLSFSKTFPESRTKETKKKKKKDNKYNRNSLYEEEIYCTQIFY